MADYTADQKRIIKRKEEDAFARGWNSARMIAGHEKQRRANWSFVLWLIACGGLFIALIVAQILHNVFGLYDEDIYRKGVPFLGALVSWVLPLALMTGKELGLPDEPVSAVGYFAKLRGESNVE